MGCTEDILREIYLDNNATTKPLPEVTQGVVEAMGEGFGNPSSDHSGGKRARMRMKLARDRVCALLGCAPEEIIFTSSGTESNNLVFYSASRKRKNARIVTTQVEHSSVNKMCSYLQLSGVRVEALKVNSDGLLDISELEDALCEKTDLVSVQWVNNETGVIQDVKRISELCREKHTPFHTDAAQAVGKLKFSLSEIDVDFLSFTAHKISGPQGAGVLYVKDKLFLNPFLFGGFQEEGFRPGTENLPGIVGLGIACEARRRNFAQAQATMRELRDLFEKMVVEFVPQTSVNAIGSQRVCNTTNIHFNGINGKNLISMLDQSGIRCSQSSACTNFEDAPSYVLLAMGLDKQHAYSSIRFSFCPENTIEQVKIVVDTIKRSCEFLRNVGG